MRAGEITPVKVTEVLGGSKIKMRSEGLLRLDATKRPIMHPLKLKLFHYYCANRQVWPNWNKFITQGYDGTATTIVRPYVTLSDTIGGVGTLGNRMGLPNIQTGQSETVNALPFAHYWNIIKNYHMDVAIDDVPEVTLTDGNNTTNVGTIFGTQIGGGFDCFNAAWKKDYFNTSRLDAQLGGAVPIPQSNVVSNNENIKVVGTAGETDLRFNTGPDRVSLTSSGAKANLQWGSETGLEMDSTAVMRDLSIAGALQIFRENRAEWGSRIIDYLRKGFGSKISSYELQEPILLNYAEKTVKFGEVLQTAEGTDPVGTLRGHGIGGIGQNAAYFEVPENGFIFTLAYIMPEPAYLSSAERFWFKETFEDYFQPEFERVGNQSILEKEIAFGYSSNTGEFGYNNRYDEYRRSLNTISGTFATTDKDWHMARDFNGVVPALTPEFIHAQPTQRIFDDTTGEVYKLMCFNEMICRSVVSRQVKRRIL